MTTDALDLLTPAEAKAAINAKPDYVDNLDVVERHVTAVSRMIDDRCGPVVRREIEGEIVWGGGDIVRVRRWPVAEFTLVRIACGTTITVLSSLAFGAGTEGYVAPPWDEDPTLFSGILLRRGPTGWPLRWEGTPALEVSYVAGRCEDTESVPARFKDTASAVLRRLWKREAGTWAQSSAYFEDTDTQAGSGFFRVAEPIIVEMLGSEVQPRKMGIG